jgi:hypothetical protein
LGTSPITLARRAQALERTKARDGGGIQGLHQALLRAEPYLFRR